MPCYYFLNVLPEDEANNVHATPGMVKVVEISEIWRPRYAGFVAEIVMKSGNRYHVLENQNGENILSRKELKLLIADTLMKMSD